MAEEHSEIIFYYQIEAKILDLIENATEEIWIVSPYLKLWARLYKILHNVMVRGIPIAFITKNL